MTPLAGARLAALAAAAAMTLAACASSTSGVGTLASSAPASTAPAGHDFPSNAPATESAAPTSAPLPATETVTESVTTPPSGPPPTSVPAAFVGTWYGHGRTLIVQADGTVHLTFRTYVDCTATVTTGCDKTTGNQIHDGGLVDAHVVHVVNPTTVYLDVTSTTAPADVPSGPVRMGLDHTHDAVALFAGQFSGAAFCGLHAPAGYCGA